MSVLTRGEHLPSRERFALLFAATTAASVVAHLSEVMAVSFSNRTSPPRGAGEAFHSTSMIPRRRHGLTLSFVSLLLQASLFVMAFRHAF